MSIELPVVALPETDDSPAINHQMSMTLVVTTDVDFRTLLS